MKPEAVFRNILVGVDRSAGADRALRHAIDLAEANRGRLGLLCVAPRLVIWASIAPFGLPVSRTQMDAELVAEACRDLDRAEHAVPADVPVTKLLARGRPVEAFVTNVLGGCWDLIVIGDRRWSLSWPAGRHFGERLIRSSPVPVLVVGHEPEPAAPREALQASALRLADVNGPARAYQPPSRPAPQS
jgi:nucleotide-binding universal stress UspA family protein